MRVKCLAQEHNTMTRPGLEAEPLSLTSVIGHVKKSNDQNKLTGAPLLGLAKSIYYSKFDGLNAKKKY